MAKKRELTEVEKAFCLSFAESLNLEFAAKSAGYSELEAKEMGYIMVRDPAVWKEIEMLKELRRRCFLSSEGDVVERQMRIAFSDITDYVEFSMVEAEVFNPKTKETELQMVNRVNFKDSKYLDGGVVSEVGTNSDGSAKIKLESRDKALDWLTKYFNMFPLDKLKAEFEIKKAEQLVKEDAPDDKSVEIRFLKQEE